MPYEVLDSEPRYHVDGFVDEMLSRTRTVIADMGPRLERLLQHMVAQFHVFQERNYLITFDAVHFAQTRWMQDGNLVIDFVLHTEAAEMPDFPRHLVIDAFVDEVIRRNVPMSLRDEMSAFTRMLVHQFMAWKKHAPGVALERITFGDVQWFGERTLVIAMKYQGEPLTPKTVRL